MKKLKNNLNSENKLFSAKSNKKQIPFQYNPILGWFRQYFSNLSWIQVKRKKKKKKEKGQVGLRC